MGSAFFNLGELLKNRLRNCHHSQPHLHHKSVKFY